MTLLLKQEQKQFMANLAHHVSAQSARSLVWENSEYLNSYQDDGETVTIVRRSVPDNFWLGFHELVKLGLARNTSPENISDEYDRSVTVSEKLLEVLLLLFSKLVHTLLGGDAGEDAGIRRRIRDPEPAETLEP